MNSYDTHVILYNEQLGEELIKGMYAVGLDIHIKFVSRYKHVHAPKAM